MPQLLLGRSRPIEEGVHDELLLLGAVYAQPFELQAASYR